MPGLLLHSPARILMELLVDHGYGVDVDDDENGAWPVFVSRSPDRPDNVIRVFDTAGVSHGDTQPDGERQEDYGFQIMIRAATHEVGYAKALAISVFLDALAREIVHIPELGTGSGTGTGTGTESGTGSAFYEYLIHAVMRTTNVIAAGSDVPQGKRQVFTINGLVSLRMCC